MYIFEEYAERINYKQIFIKYAEKSFVLFDNYPHEILEIEKITSPNSPNKFRIMKYFASTQPNLKYIDVDWDVYEEFITDNYKGIKNAIDDSKIVFIYSWEIFLLQNQIYFVNSLGHKSIYKTIDPSLSENERINNISCVVDILKLENPMIYNAWKNFKFGPDNYSYWLANIINA